MTTADVIPTKSGATPQQDGKSLTLSVLTPEHIKASTIMMDRPPMALDRKIDNLKKVELRIPAYIFPDKKATIKVRLSLQE